METCKKCGYAGMVKTQHCPRCGSSLVKEPKKCDCGAIVKDSDNFCPECGKPLN